MRAASLRFLPRWLVAAIVALASVAVTGGVGWAQEPSASAPSTGSASATPPGSVPPLGADDPTRVPGTTNTPSGLPWTVVLSREAAPGRLSNLVTWDGGFAALEVGDDAGKARPGIWTSPDGRSWTAQRLPAGARSVWSLLPFDGGLTAVTLKRPDPRSFELVLWRSGADGTWARAGEVGARVPDALGPGWYVAPVAIFSAGDHITLLASRRYEPGAGGAVTVPLAEQDRPLAMLDSSRHHRILAWTSADGSHWTRGQVTGLGDPDAIARMQLLGTFDDGVRLVSFGSTDRMMLSPDGLAWAEDAPMPLDMEAGGAIGLTSSAGGFLLHSDADDPPGGERCGNRLGLWALEADGRWSRILDAKPAVVYGMAATGATVVIAGHSWCQGPQEWSWIAVSTDGAESWRPEYAWTGAPGSCMADVAVRAGIVVMLDCSTPGEDPASEASIWTAPLP